MYHLDYRLCSVQKSRPLPHSAPFTGHGECGYAQGDRVGQQWGSMLDLGRLLQAADYRLQTNIDDSTLHTLRTISSP
jgi:hypothetical protein